MAKLRLLKSICVLVSLCVLTATLSSAQTFTTVSSFNDTDGSYPAGTLVQGLDGNLYGTTNLGGTGANLCGYYGDKECGTVFKISRGGRLTTLLSFDRSQGAILSPAYY